MSNQRIIRLPEVCRLLGLARSTVLRMERRPNGTFPKKFKIGDAHAIGWRESEILAWIEARGKPTASAAATASVPS